MTARLGKFPCLAAAAVAGALLVASCAQLEPTTGPEARPKPSAPTSAEVPDPDAHDPIVTRLANPAPLRTRPRPNLLMITVDDAALKDMPYLPHVKNLIAGKGVTIDNGISPTPICVPARASILSGQYAHNHGAVTISGEGGGFDAFRGESDDDVLPVWLSRAGYKTMFLGKYLNGYGEKAADYRPPGWSLWSPLLDPTTYNYTAPILLDHGKPVQKHTYSTVLLQDESEWLIRRQAIQRKPWFMWVNYVAPHSGGPREPGDPKTIRTPAVKARDRDTFADLPNSQTPDMFESDVSDKTVVPATQTFWSERLRVELREARQQRIESLQAVDRAVRDTIRTLRKTGQLGSTYIVFTSDNGFALGEHNVTGKLFYFTDILHVPMLIRGPGIPQGVHSKAPVSNADWAPTLAALAGAKPGRDVDGVDVLPWLNSKATRRVIPIEGYPVNGGLKPRYQGVVVGPWTYVRGRGGHEELYDRDVDNYQLVNVSKDPRFKMQLRKLRHLAASADDCVAATCPREFLR